MVQGAEDVLEARHVMKKNNDYPHWREEYKSRRHFQSVKRADMDAAIRALERARRGAAWLPLCEKFKHAVDDIHLVREAMRKKEWK